MGGMFWVGRFGFGYGAAKPSELGQPNQRGQREPFACGSIGRDGAETDGAKGGWTEHLQRLQRRKNGMGIFEN
jgi:hypothetical protein